MTNNSEITIIASKPLQLMVAWICANQLGSTKTSSVIMVDLYRNAKQTTNKLRVQNIFRSVVFTRSRFMSFVRAAVQKRSKILLIDGDVGTRLYLYILMYKILNNSKIIVYEEGVGTYKRNLYIDKTYGRLKNKIFNVLGIATFFGENQFVDYVMIFRPNHYRNPKKFQAIETNLQDFINQNIISLSTIFNVESFKLPAGDDCVLYLTSWDISSQIIKHLEANASDVFLVKPHPHIKPDVSLGVSCDIIPAEIPSELIITLCISKYKSITVYHHGSSTEKYIRDNNLRFVNL